jgi:polar amino acid transport system substrate-binding protein
MIITILAAFTGCSAKEPAAANTKSTGFAKLQEQGYVVVGLDDTFVPMGFRDAKGEIVGFDVDLAKEVFKRTGLEVKFQPIDWSMKESELNSGNIDMIWNGYTITAERKEKVAFSEPYIASRQVIVTLADSAINAKADLAGKTVATQSASSSLDAINTEPGLAASFEGGEPVLFATNNEALMDMEAGRTDAVVADEIMIRYYITERGQEKYKILDEDFGADEYGIGIRKEDTELLEKVNKTLDEMKADGSSAAISEKWFGENIIK